MKEKIIDIKKYTALSLGYLGLLPPLLALGASLTSHLSALEGFEFNLLYANMILSFLGGTHWYAGITSQLGAPTRKILVGIISSIAGITSLLIGGVIGAFITTAGLLVLGFIEKYQPLSEEDGIDWYISLRIKLTAGLTSLLLVSLWLSV